MTELPEVETVRRVLLNDLIGLKIEDVIIKYDRIIDCDKSYFISNIKNKTFTDIKRRGKYLIFCLNEGYLISHLRMEGKYFYLNKELDNKHIHVIFNLSNGYKLMYQDTRKFGRMIYLNGDIYNKEPLNKLGYDPILDGMYDLDLIYKKIISKKIEIKTVLLNQEIITGLGNIYVDEVLFSSHINPLRLANSLNKEEVKAILDSSIKILNDAIINKGTTIRSYTSSLGVEGNYQNFLNVHTKSECPHCKMNIIRVKIKGRMTYYCKNCQR